jgi:hypothetical protein
MSRADRRARAILSRRARPVPSGAGKKQWSGACDCQPAPMCGTRFFFLARKIADQRLDGPAACYQVNDRHNQRDHEQQMDQATRHMESPAQKPENDEDCKYRPEHIYPLRISRLIEPATSEVRGSISGRSCLLAIEFGPLAGTGESARRMRNFLRLAAPQSKQATREDGSRTIHVVVLKTTSSPRDRVAERRPNA